MFMNYSIKNQSKMVTNPFSSRCLSQVTDLKRPLVRSCTWSVFVSGDETFSARFHDVSRVSSSEALNSSPGMPSSGYLKVFYTFCNVSKREDDATMQQQRIYNRTVNKLRSRDSQEYMSYVFHLFLSHI